VKIRLEIDDCVLEIDEVLSNVDVLNYDGSTRRLQELMAEASTQIVSMYTARHLKSNCCKGS